ncbi:tail tape measure protein [Sphingomonas sp.]|uniref:tail tape measure protein n=1 Tax=Sphingomonas sp. TaxID=28214 RepID=UPI002DD68043|nr:tail tape measure protein [Sphingomonas sp.]
MDEEIERLVIGVRADTQGFARDVAAMRGELDGPLAAGAERAGRAIEAGLLRAVRTGKLGFDDLRRMAVSVLAEIAQAAVRSGIGAIGMGGGRGGGHGGLLTAIAGLIGGSAARATGGPVAPGVAYMVGERGPELFVPTASGRVEAGRAAGPAREVRVAITVNAGPGEAPAALARSGRQVARAVRRALEGID